MQNIVTAEKIKKECNIINIASKKTLKFDEKLEGEFPKVVIKAVNWWMAAIINPKKDNEYDQTINIELMLLNLNNEFYTNVEQEEINLFRNELALVITEQLRKSNNIVLELKDGLQNIINEILCKVGIDCYLPQNTTMILKNDEILVKAGKFAPWVRIF